MSQLIDYEKILKGIARGRPDNGRPLSANMAQDMARRILTKYTVSWSDKPVKIAEKQFRALD